MDEVRNKVEPMVRVLLAFLFSRINIDAVSIVLFKVKGLDYLIWR
jgi:hypothetical protein